MSVAVLDLLAFASLALALLYAAMTLGNLRIFRAPEAGPCPPAVSILIPARDEAGQHRGRDRCRPRAGAAWRWRSWCSTTARRTARASSWPTIAARDPRVRLAQGASLAPGWNGKQHACHQLAALARHPVWLFTDADVRLAPDAAARLGAHMDRHDLAFVSGFPRQVTGSLAEAVVIPQILVVLLGYLPLAMARRSADAGFAAGCGQLMMVRAEAYAAAGGHAAFRHLMHDGLNLPRNIRRTGGRTDIVDATPLAACRMYDTWAGIWRGFQKNATEGMATPRALPVWTALLGGGHVLPWLVAPLALAAGAGLSLAASLAAIAFVLVARAVLAVRMRQPAVSVILHPVGVALTLAIQWSALIGARRGRRTTWRGRSYDFQ